MSKQVMIDLLDRANNGSDLLQILDVIVGEQSLEGYANEPQGDVIAM